MRLRVGWALHACMHVCRRMSGMTEEDRCDLASGDFLVHVGDRRLVDDDDDDGRVKSWLSRFVGGYFILVSALSRGGVLVGALGMGGSWERRLAQSGIK